MAEFIEIRWTSGSIDEARKICRYLVQERFAASAKILPWVEAISMWNNQLETTQESQITLMARKDQFDKIGEVIRNNSKYQIPEIAFFPVQGGDQEYLNWIEASSQPFEKSLRP